MTKYHFPHPCSPIEIEDSCGCVWCDMGIKPQKAYGKDRMHISMFGTYECTKPDQASEHDD